MYFWATFCLTLVLGSISFIGIIFFVKKSKRNDMEKYTFRTEEGEEIPIGI